MKNLVVTLAATALLMLTACAPSKQTTMQIDYSDKLYLDCSGPSLGAMEVYKLWDGAYKTYEYMTQNKSDKYAIGWMPPEATVSYNNNTLTIVNYGRISTINNVTCVVY